MCDSSFGLRASLTSCTVRPPSRQQAQPRSPATTMWCSAARRPGPSTGFSPAARFMPGSHQRDTISGLVMLFRSTMHRMWSVKPSKCAET